jgi:hypothetical protein
MHFIEPCLPTISRSVPTGPQWAYEKLPAITRALKALPVRSVVLDGEGVMCGHDGRSEFDRMRACLAATGRQNVPLRVRFPEAGRPRHAHRAMGQAAYCPGADPGASISKTWTALPYFGRHASCAWKASSPSGATVDIGQDVARQLSEQR